MQVSLLRKDIAHMEEREKLHWKPLVSVVIYVTAVYNLKAAITGVKVTVTEGYMEL